MNAAKRAHAEAWIADAFGTSLREHQAHSLAPFPNAYVKEAVEVITRSGAQAHLAKWREEDGVQRRGRKAYVPMHSALILMLMHLREGRGLLFSEMSGTLAHRLTDPQLAQIGIRPRRLAQTSWYTDLLGAVDRLIALIDAYPGPQRALLKRGEYATVLASRDPEECERKRERASLLANEIVRGSVDLVPSDLFKRWIGNSAFDATFFEMSGKAGNPTHDNDAPRRSCNYDCGWYIRGGSHDGDAAPRQDKRYWGLELSTITMTANAPGERADFPLLTVGIEFHKPGKIKQSGERLLANLQRNNYPTGHVMCDRAYMPGALQVPFIDAGYTPVFDYGIDDFGIKDQFEHAILVMGSWYVAGMPTELVEAEILNVKTLTALRSGHVTSKAGLTAATKLVKGNRRQLVEAEMRAVALTAENEGVDERAIAEQLLTDRRAARAVYRLTRKGKMRPDKSQQYSYPDPSTYIIVDPDTGELAPPLAKRTVVIPRLEKGARYAQHYVHNSEKWQGWYSLRNTVEGSYGHVKDVLKEDLGSAAKRRKRGNTFAFIAMALAIASANIRKLRDFIVHSYAATPVTSKNRHSFGLDAELLSTPCEPIAIATPEPPPQL